MLRKIFCFWAKMGFVAQFLVITIACGTIIFAPMFAREDWSKWTASEESYKSLEEVAYNIIETKDATQPLSESLERYEINAKTDGTMVIKLYSNDDMAYLKLTLSDDYQIKEFERGSEKGTFVIGGILLLIAICVAVGLAVYIIGFCIYIGIKKMVQKIKNEKNKDKIKS